MFQFQEKFDTKLCTQAHTEPKGSKTKINKWTKEDIEKEEIHKIKDKNGNKCRSYSHMVNNSVRTINLEILPVSGTPSRKHLSVKENKIFILYLIWWNICAHLFSFNCSRNYYCIFSKTWKLAFREVRKSATKYTAEKAFVSIEKKYLVSFFPKSSNT